MTFAIVVGVWCALAFSLTALIARVGYARKKLRETRLPVHAPSDLAHHSGDDRSERFGVIQGSSLHIGGFTYTGMNNHG